jgi:hypothetical protein
MIDVIMSKNLPFVIPNNTTAWVDNIEGEEEVV